MEQYAPLFGAVPEEVVGVSADAAVADQDDELGDDPDDDDGLIRAPAAPVAALSFVSGRIDASGDGTGDAETTDSEPEAAPGARELEDTIRRIIREELSGEMGRRMSDNLRRMVRDEVARAMLRRD